MNTNEDTKKKIFSKAITILIVLALILGVGFAYARYITRLNGKSTADIAKWSFKVNGKTNENLSIDLANTRAGIEQEAEVQEGYIGPGTAGAFELVLDATGSDVSLEYDINLNVDYSNNEVFPKNLIFYTDSTMQNAIYHTDNNINLNGFIGWNDGSKVHTKTIYWKWDYETGSTQTEINNNDIADSFWMGKPITLSMNVTAKQVNDNPTTGEYTVTFDANGGTIQGYGNASQASKQVTYGGTYGDLPTPTREGYTFMGWNGKNKIDIAKAVNDNLIDNNDGTYTIWKNSGLYLERISNDLIIHIPANTEFYVSCEVLEYNGSYFWPFQLQYHYAGGGDTTSSVGKQKRSKDIIRITIYQEGSQPDGTYTKFKNLQLEMGSVATAYEPYYITSSTEVVQNQNHTLTAIWEPITGE